MHPVLRSSIPLPPVSFFSLLDMGEQKRGMSGKRAAVICINEKISFYKINIYILIHLLSY